MPNGDIYDGEWYRNETNGYGVKVFSNGDMHIGNYSNDCREGKGFYRWIHGDEYDGFWVNGEQCGLGSYKWGNVNAICKGNWERGERHGGFFFKRQIEINNGSSALLNDLIYFEVWRKGEILHRERIDWQSWSDLPSIEELYNDHASSYKLDDTDEAEVTNNDFTENWKHAWESLGERYSSDSMGSSLRSFYEHDGDDSNSQSIPLEEKSFKNWYQLPKNRNKGNRKSSLLPSGVRHKVRITSRRCLRFHLRHLDSTFGQLVSR